MHYNFETFFCVLYPLISQLVERRTAVYSLGILRLLVKIRLKGVIFVCLDLQFAHEHGCNSMFKLKLFQPSVMLIHVCTYSLNYTFS